MANERQKPTTDQFRENMDKIEWNSKKDAEPLSEASLMKMAEKFKGQPLGMKPGKHDWSPEKMKELADGMIAHGMKAPGG
jgi:hypothetical protein